MDLATIQNELQHRYDLRCDYRIEDFLLQDQAIAKALRADDGLPELPEQILIQQSEQALSISVFLDRQITRTLEADSPGAALHNGNLDAYWYAVEGVSHFLCLAWHATHERSVTQLELELVAEIDKFLCAAMCLTQQVESARLTSLHCLLFRNFRWEPSADVGRYHEANRLAGGYCQWLQQQYLEPGLRGMGSELRRFFRMPKVDKLHHINRRVSALHG